MKESAKLEIRFQHFVKTCPFTKCNLLSSTFKEIQCNFPHQATNIMYFVINTSKEFLVYIFESSSILFVVVVI